MSLMLSGQSSFIEVLKQLSAYSVIFSIHWRIGDSHRIAAFAFAIDDFFIGEHGAQRRTPVHRNLGHIGETLLIQLKKDPLRPL